jgi:hypothetical protein
LNLLEQLNNEFLKASDELFDLEGRIEILQDQAEDKKQNVQRLAAAIRALTGVPDTGLDRQPTLPEVQPERVPVPALPMARREPTGPLCNGCGGEMGEGYRVLGNGKQVRLWICNDSGCNNETLA